MYGPFHRRQSPTQDLETAARQALSGEIWGRLPAFSAGLRQVPTVKAYVGSLPPAAEGVEFYTGIAPSGTRPFLRWFTGDPGVLPVPGATDTVLIPATVVRVRQSRPGPADAA